VVPALNQSGEDDSAFPFRRIVAMARVPLNALLPDEVLLQAFVYHVWHNGDTPQRLLRVCRRWHNITVNSPSLWGDILYTDQFSLKALRMDARAAERRLENKIICTTINALAQAIQRTKNQQFELTIILFGSPSDKDDHNLHFLQIAWFTERCRALRIQWDYTRPYLAEYFDQMQALEELDIDVGGEFCPAMVSLLKIVAQTSVNLRHLRIRSQSNQIHLHHFSSFASRLTSLDLNIDQVVDFVPVVADSTSLYRLAISHTIYNQANLSSFAVLPFLQDLSIHGIHPSIASNLYSGLTSLRLHYVHYRHSYSFLLPQLTHLVLSGSWNPVTQMDAPRLRKITLLNGYYRQSDHLRLIPCLGMHPRSLEMDVTRENEDFQFLFSNTWDELERLQVTYISDGYRFQDFLSTTLTGTKKRRPVCPRLWHLVIVGPSLSERDKAQTRATLRRIVEGRRGTGKLRCARVGWYPAPESNLDPYLSLSSEDLVNDAEIAWENVL